LRHGSYSRVPLTELPSPFKHVRRFVNEFRRWVEAELMERSGTITAYQAKRLHTACLAMRHLACVERLMKTSGPPPNGLKPEVWMAYADRVVRYSETADRALKDLGLDRTAARSPWDVLDAAPYAQADAEQGPTPQDSQEANQPAPEP